MLVSSNHKEGGKPALEQTSLQNDTSLRNNYHPGHRCGRCLCWGRRGREHSHHSHHGGGTVAETSSGHSGEPGKGETGEPFRNRLL